MGDGVERFITAEAKPDDAALAELLDNYENERRVLIMRLRFIEGRLVQHRRLRVESLPTRTT